MCYKKEIKKNKKIFIKFFFFFFINLEILNKLKK